MPGPVAKHRDHATGVGRTEIKTTGAIVAGRVRHRRHRRPAAPIPAVAEANRIVIPAVGPALIIVAIGAISENVFPFFSDEQRIR